MSDGFNRRDFLKLAVMWGTALGLEATHLDRVLAESGPGLTERDIESYRRMLARMHEVLGGDSEAYLNLLMAINPNCCSDGETPYAFGRNLELLEPPIKGMWIPPWTDKGFSGENSLSLMALSKQIEHLGKNGPNFDDMTQYLEDIMRMLYYDSLPAGSLCSLLSIDYAISHLNAHPLANTEFGLSIKIPELIKLALLRGTARWRNGNPDTSLAVADLSIMPVDLLKLVQLSLAYLGSGIEIIPWPSQSPFPKTTEGIWAEGRGQYVGPYFRNPSDLGLEVVRNLQIPFGNVKSYFDLPPTIRERVSQQDLEVLKNGVLQLFSDPDHKSVAIAYVKRKVQRNGVSYLTGHTIVVVGARMDVSGRLMLQAWDPMFGNMVEIPLSSQGNDEGKTIIQAMFFMRSPEAPDIQPI